MIDDTQLSPVITGYTSEMIECVIFKSNDINVY